jgi:RNA polymerase-binding transcription factor DksA
MTTKTLATPRTATADPDLYPRPRALLEEQWRHQLGDVTALARDAWSASDEPDDDGSRATDQLVAARLLEAARKQLDETEDALARLDAGTYGACTRCGDQISSERLEILPAARYCVGCQARTATR